MVLEHPGLSNFANPSLQPALQSLYAAAAAAHLAPNRHHRVPPWAPFLHQFGMPSGMFGSPFLTPTSASSAASASTRPRFGPVAPAAQPANPAGCLLDGTVPRVRAASGASSRDDDTVTDPDDRSLARHRLGIGAGCSASAALTPARTATRVTAVTTTPPSRVAEVVAASTPSNAPATAAPTTVLPTVAFHHHIGGSFHPHGHPPMGGLLMNNRILPGPASDDSNDDPGR